MSVPNLRNGKVFWGQAQQGINCIPSFSKLYFDMVMVAVEMLLLRS